MNKKYLIISFISILAIVTLIILETRHPDTSANITTSKAFYGSIAKSVTATGTIEPLDTVSVGAQVSGVVRKVYVDYNSIVKKGQLLAQVDASILTAQDDESKANLVTAQSNFDLQKANYDRQTKLYNIGAISKADYQISLNLFNDSKAALENAKAQLRVANKTLAYTNIYSPVDGVVLNRNVSEGQTIASSFNAPVLFVIAKDLTKMQVYAAVDEADIGDVKTGQDVAFTVDAYPSEIFKGTVALIRLEPSVSANVVTYSTQINVDNSKMKLRPGMTASINVFTEEDSSALLIPIRALSVKVDSSLQLKYVIQRAETINQPNNFIAIKKPDQVVSSKNSINTNNKVHYSHVWIKNGNTLIEKKIITGLADDQNIRVLDGLSVGDEVVTSIINGGDKKDGNKVQRSPFMPQSQQRPSGSPRN